MPQSANFAHILISFVAGCAFVFVCNIKNIFYASAGGCLRYTFFPAFLFFRFLCLCMRMRRLSVFLLLLSLRYSCFLHLCEIDRRAKDGGGEVEQGVALTHTPLPLWHSQVIIMRGMHIIIISIFMIIPVICHSCCLHLRFPGLGLPLCPSPLFLPPCFACQLGKLCAIFNF